MSLGQTFPVPPQGYGGEVTIFNLLCGLRDLGVRADLAAPHGSLNPAGALIDTGPPTTSWEGNEAAYRVYSERFDDYDVIHSNQHDAWPFVGRRGREKYLPIVHTVQGITTWAAPPKEGPLHFVTLTEWHRSDTRERIGVDSKVIHNPIVLDTAPFRAKKEDYYIYFGLIAPQKGADVAMEVAKAAKVPFVLCGETRFVPTPEFVDFVRKKAADEGVTFIESPSMEQKWDLLSKARGVILPFLGPESGSLLVLEAQACGTEVYVHKLGGLAELPGRDIRELKEDRPRNAFEVRDSVRGYDCREIAHRYLDVYNQSMEMSW